jgi:hypothetical protein
MPVDNRTGPQRVDAVLSDSAIKALSMGWTKGVTVTKYFPISLIAPRDQLDSWWIALRRKK